MNAVSVASPAISRQILVATAAHDIGRRADSSMTNDGGKARACIR